ncbi:MAG: hypothetical protein ABEL51_14580 [Salinibacter sp.]
MIARSWTFPREEWAGPDAHPDASLLLAERARQVVLSRTGDAPETEWRRAHIFTTDWHLRWHRLGSQIRAVAIGEVPTAGGWDEPDATLDLEDAETSEREVVLWGRRQAGEKMWLELRIPNLMTPPKQHPSGHGGGFGDEHVRRTLRFVAYQDASTGRTVIFRFAGIGYARTDGEDTTFEVLSGADA